MNRPKATDDLRSTVRVTIAGCVVLLTVGVLFVVTALLAQGQTTTSDDVFTTAYTPWKEALTTVFWVGEEEGPDNGFIQNRASAWDVDWMGTFGGVDDPTDRCGFAPCGFVPNQSPFYVALPYNDLDESGQQKENASRMPWYDSEIPNTESQMEGRYVAVQSGTAVCYGQVRDVGPFEEDDVNYVFGTSPNPINQNQLGAGLDISPAMRDCLGVEDVSRTRWRFVPESEVPSEQSSGSGEYLLVVPEGSMLSTPFDVSWHAPFPRPNTKSWVGVYEPGASDQLPIDWSRIEDYEQTGTFTVALTRPGTYEVRLFAGATYNRVYTESFEIGTSAEEGAYTLSLDQVPQAGSMARVAWTTPSPRPARRSWVGLYRPEDAHTDPIEWERIPDNVLSGVYEVPVPGTGAYEIRLFRGATYDEVATVSVTIDEASSDGSTHYAVFVDDSVPTGAVSVSWSTPQGSTDRKSWVGCYKVGAADEEPLSWSRIPDNTQTGSWRTRVDTPGMYEVRFFRGASYDAVVARQFEATDDVPTQREYDLAIPNQVRPGTETTAYWNTPATASEVRSWIGVYTKDARSQDPISWERIPDGMESGVYLFVLDAPGTYELRLFKGATYTVAAVLPFSVAGTDTGAVENPVDESAGSVDTPIEDSTSADDIVSETNHAELDAPDETIENAYAATDTTQAEIEYSNSEETQAETQLPNDTGDESTESARRHHRQSGQWRHERR